MKFTELPSREAVLTPEKEIKFFGDEDIELIYNEARAFRNHSNYYPKYSAGQAIILLMYTGMRVGEALGLTWEDVNFEKCQITINNAITTIKNRTTNAIRRYLSFTQCSFNCLLFCCNYSFCALKVNTSTDVFKMQKNYIADYVNALY